MSDGLIGLGSLFSAWLFVMWLRPSPLLAAWLVLIATTLPMLRRELGRFPATGAHGTGAGQPLAWLIGFVVAAAPMLVLHGQGAGVTSWAAAWVVAAPAFALRLMVGRRRGSAPYCGLPLAIGRAVLGADRAELNGAAATARLWLLKAFFIPLYGASLLGLLAAALGDDLHGPLAWLALAVTLAYTIDLAFGLSGYVFASDTLLPTVRSTQPRLAGWLVCLPCYGPVFAHWTAFGQIVHGEIGWPATLAAGAGSAAAAVLMLALLALYVSATVTFGLRFSNLSNRGVITAGPYRYMKHPAYFAHVANAWIITFLFLPAAGVELTPSRIAVPIAFALLYRCRAVTEELHLREDARYVAYCDWIARHGAVGRLRSLAVRVILRRRVLIAA